MILKLISSITIVYFMFTTIHHLSLLYINMITKVLNLLINIYNLSLCTVYRWNGKISVKFCKTDSKLSFFIK